MVALDTRVKLNRPRDKSNNFIDLEVAEELFSHYKCKGCSKFFIVGQAYNPNFCPNCGKRVKEITCTK